MSETEQNKNEEVTPEECDHCPWKPQYEQLHAEQVYLLQDLRNILGDYNGVWSDDELKSTVQGLVDFKKQQEDPEVADSGEDN